MRWLGFLAIVGSLVSVACEDDGGGANPTSTSTTGGSSTGSAGDTTSGAADAVGDSEGASSSGADSSGSADDTIGSSTGALPVSCTAPLLDETFEIDPAGPDGQIQPGVYYDAAVDGVWIAYNAPAPGSSQFDVYVTRIDCGGNAQLEPVRVNATLGDNDIDPELARSGDDVLVVWSADDGTGGSSNLSIRMQSLDADGAPQWADDHRLATTLDERPFGASAWMPRIAATDAGFAIIGTRAIESASAFQVFVQPVDGQGASVGATAAFTPGVGVANDTPHLAVDGDAVVAAWVRTEDFELRQVETGRVVGGAFDDPSPTLLLEADAVGPALAVGPAGPVLAVSEAAGAGRRIRLSRLGGDAVALAGEGGGVHHNPALTSVPDGLAVLWMENLGGFSNALLLAHVTDDGDAIAIGTPITIDDAIAAPYATTITHVGGGVVFVAWAQGASPNFRVYGRFVSLADR